MPQFVKKAFARGTKLNVEHVYTPLADVQVGLEDATVENLQEDKAPHRMTWTFPAITSRAFEYSTGVEQSKAHIFMPFVVPPLQRDFDATTLQMPDNYSIITELAVSFDQRGEAMGITDSYCIVSGSAEGKLTKTAMSRYTIVLTLVERTPTLYGGSVSDYTILAQFTMSGADLFGNAFYNQNPLLVDELNIPLHPYRSYAWMLRVEGLYSDNVTTERLEMPSFMLSTKLMYPVVQRISTVLGNVQNLPSNHLGVQQTGTIALTTPAANAIIDGDTDIQNPLKLFDTIMQNKLRSGYGSGSGGNLAIGMEQDTYPWEQLLKDTTYSTIVVPMWQTVEEYRGRDVPNSLPYIGAGPAYLVPTGHRQVIRVPSGFVIHHVVAVWNVSSYRCPNTGGYANPGIRPSTPSFTNKVGVAICNGLRADDFRYQQIAYATWTPADYTTKRIDEFGLAGVAASPNFVLMHVPLVAPIGNNNTDSYYLTGDPFFVGGGNSKTRVRTETGQLPEAYGGGAYATPATKGTETFLEVRWTMEDTVTGLENLGDEEVMIGYGGHQVLIIGEQTFTS